VLDPVPNLAGWPLRPVIAVGDGAGGWIDATCSFTGLELSVGPADDHFDFPAAHLVIALDNRDGRWSRFNADGTPAGYGPGTPLAVYALTQPGAVGYWLFSGWIARNDQAADDSVTWECFDAFSDLAQPVGTLTAGATGDLPGARVTAILAAARRTDLRTRLAVGQASLATVADDDAPLDQLERAVSSDGGVIYIDADGTVRTYDRHWRNGRQDQPRQWMITDNICDNPAVDATIWEAITSSTDDGLADRVVLENTAGLRAEAGGTGGRYVYTETDQLWRSQADGDRLAADLFADQRLARIRLDSASVHLFDPNQPELWQAVDWRLFDRLSFIHRQRVAGGGTVDFAAEVLISELHHALTPAGGWRIDFATSRATGTHVPLQFWDTTPYTWDHNDPNNVWS
jgi:hypothetical protein